MPKDAQPREKLSLTLSLAILGILTGLLSTWLLSRLKVPTGTQLILCGLALFGQGLVSGWYLARSLERSLTGRTSNRQAALQQAQMMKQDPCSQLADLMPSGAPPSPRKPRN